MGGSHDLSSQSMAGPNPDMDGAQDSLILQHLAREPGVGIQAHPQLGHIEAVVVPERREVNPHPICLRPPFHARNVPVLHGADDRVL